jgi:hypothetical protein
MKKIILIVFIILSSCKQEKIIEKHCTYKYKEGDIVYIKLDNKKVIISERLYFLEDKPNYRIFYKNGEGNYETSIIKEIYLKNGN